MLGLVYGVRFARSVFLGQVCWMRFAGLGFTGLGVLGGGDVLDGVSQDLLVGIYWIGWIGLVCLI